MAASASGIKVSIGTRPQAKADYFTNLGITEDSSSQYKLNVMANDAGGSGKSLYSLNASNDQNALLVKDGVNISDYSTMGANIWLTNDGQVGYQLNEKMLASLQSLAQGVTLIDSFTYAIEMGNGTLSMATAHVQITGLNDAPVVTGMVSGAATENGTVVSLDALANAKDMDQGAVLQVVDVPAKLPAGVTYDTNTHSFLIDPSHAAYQSLAEGESTVVTVSYGVSDGMATSAASASWMVTGANDIAMIGGDTSAAVTEDTNVVAGLLTTGGKLSITDADHDQAGFIARTNVNGSSGLGSFNLSADGTWTYSIDNTSAVQALKAYDKPLTDSFTATSLDGSASQVVNMTIYGQDEAIVNSKPLPIGNNGFEYGTDEGWSVIGRPFFRVGHASEGTHNIKLSALGAPAGVLEKFLNLGSGSLESLGNGQITAGSAVKHMPIDIKAGQTVSIDWSFSVRPFVSLTSEPYHSAHVNSFNKFAAITVGDGTAIELADFFGLRSADTTSTSWQTTGWQTFEYKAEKDMNLVIGLVGAITTSAMYLDETIALQVDNLLIY